MHIEGDNMKKSASALLEEYNEKFNDSKPLDAFRLDDYRDLLEASDTQDRLYFNLLKVGFMLGYRHAQKERQGK